MCVCEYVRVVGLWNTIPRLCDLSLSDPLLLLLLLLLGAFSRRCGGRSRPLSLSPSPMAPAFFLSLFCCSFALRNSRCFFSSSHFSRSFLMRSSRSTRARSLQIPGLQSGPCWGHVHLPFFFTLVGGSCRGWA